MAITGRIIRPPSEAESFLLQVTVGCSSNSCSFCGAYKGKKFLIKDIEEIFGDILSEQKAAPATRRVFLLDGDALAAPDSKLIPVLYKLQAAFPGLTRVSSYVNGYNVAARTGRELEKLRENKLTLIYMGLESGSRKILQACGKASSAGEMTEAVLRCADAGIKTSVMVLLGLGGCKNSAEHVEETVKVLNKMQPAFLSFLSVMLIPGTGLYKDAASGRFEELDSGDLLREARGILSGLDLKKTVFRSDHASNHLPLEGRLPRDRGRLIAVLDDALKGNRVIRPDFIRGL